MHLVNLSDTKILKNNSMEDALHREKLKLSDLDTDTMTDLENMFGTWFEVDHCDKDIR